MGKVDLKILEQEYLALEPLAKRLLNSIRTEINNLIQDDIKLGFPVQYRIKTWESIVNKLESGRFNVKKSIQELQDLVGLRIILLFRKDAQKVVEIIRTSLEVLKEYDPNERLEDDQFGYSSTHLVCKIPHTWSKVPSFSGLENLKFEIQIRTLSQHSWAEFSNNFQYKVEESVPKELRRAIGRISALLEMVDFEYERLILEREQYKVIIDENSSNSDEVILNVDILESILDKLLPEKNKSDYEDYSFLLQDLRERNIYTSSELESLIEGHLARVLASEKKIIESNVNDDNLSYSADDRKRMKEGVYFTHTGLVRMAITDKFFKE